MSADYAVIDRINELLDSTDPETCTASILDAGLLSCDLSWLAE